MLAEVAENGLARFEEHSETVGAFKDKLRDLGDEGHAHGDLGYAGRATRS